MWPYIRLRDFFVWSCDISHLLLLIVKMLLDHGNAAGRVGSRVALSWSFHIFDSFLRNILGCISPSHLMHSLNWVTALSCKKTFAHWALYLSCVSCRSFCLIRLHHWGIHLFIIWTTSSGKCLWSVSRITGLEFLLAILNALIFVFLRNNWRLLEMLRGIRYHDVCRMLLVIKLCIVHDVWEGGKIRDCIDVYCELFNGFLSRGDMIVWMTVLLLASETWGMRLFRRIASC